MMNRLSPVRNGRRKKLGIVLETHPHPHPQEQNGTVVAGGNGPGGAKNQLSRPFSLHVLDDETIIVADAENSRIVEWKKGATSGQIVASRLNWPTDVIVDKETDSLIICDQGNRRVMKWSRRQGTTQGEILIGNIDCYGITMDDQRNLYVTDWKKAEVRRFKMGEKTGAIVAGGNEKGNALNQLNYPHYVFVDREHSVYVSDYYNHRVMKWVKGAPEGIVVAGGRGEGSELTQLSFPTGIFVDEMGPIYVEEEGNGRVTRWFKGEKKGSLIVGGGNQLEGPEGLKFDRHGNLYVVGNGNHRVQRFSIASN